MYTPFTPEHDEVPDDCNLENASTTSPKGLNSIYTTIYVRYRVFTRVTCKHI